MIRSLPITLGLLAALAALAMGQGLDRDTDPGISIILESSYRQESVSLMIIREQSRAESREMKVLALKNIRSAIDRGITDGEVLSALEYMAMEGIVNKTLYNNRIRNNYPDIRCQAAAYLGDLGSRNAHTILLKMTQAEYEPMVLTEVLKSLTKIGINDNNETIRMINKRLHAFDVLLPDNRLALAALEAYETFASKGGTLDAPTIQVIQDIAKGRYHGAIREQARQLLVMLHTYSQTPRPEDLSE
jgi:hypothetical protein